MARNGVASLEHSPTVPYGSRLVANHLWSSDISNQYQTVH